MFRFLARGCRPFSTENDPLDRFPGVPNPRTDEMSSTGGHRFFAPFSTENDPLDRFPGVPNPRTDEIPSTGGHRFFAHWQSSELRPLALPPGVPNPGMTSVGCQFRGFCVTHGSEIRRHIRNLDRSLAKAADQRKDVLIVRREGDQVEADIRARTVNADHDVHHGDIQAG